MTETRRSNVVIVTGTDTGVGKTWTTAALARALSGLGARVVAMKVIETGCGMVAAEREDGVVLARATGQKGPTEGLIRLKADLAPAVAAEHEGLSIDFDELLLKIEGHATDADVVLLEGSGGLLTPITWEWAIVDIAQALEARAIVVASDRLGVINHTLLTLGALELAAVPVLAVVLNGPATADASTGTNAGAIARLAGFTRIHATPRTEDEAKAEAAMVKVAREVLAVMSGTAGR